MSECISSRGEYSSHEYVAGECESCGHVNLSLVRAEALREAADEVGAWGPACIPAAQALRAKADNLATP